MFFMRSKSKDEEDNFEPNFDDMMSEVLPAMSLQAMAGVKEMPPIEEESQQQWVDDNGVNWVKQPDGSMMYFDNTTGQWTPYSN
jgi:hypothetical protein